MDVGQIIVNIIANTAGLTAGITEAQAKLEGLQGAATQAGGQMGAGLDKTAAGAGSAGQAMTDAGAAAAQAAAATGAAAQEAGSRVASVAPKVSAAAREAAAAVKGLGKNASEVGMAMSVGLSAPIAILGGIGVKSAADFSSQMELIHTQAGASQQEVDNLSKSVLQMAYGATQGPVALSQGLYHLESVGIHGARAMNDLHVAAEGATAGNANLEDVTNALAAAMVSHVQGAQNASQAMGTLNAIVGAGNMRMQDLATAMSSGVLPAAQAFGVTLPEVGAALATMTDAGVPAADAATRLRMMFSQLGAPTKQAAKILTDLGMGTTEMAQDMRKPNGLVVALADLTQHMNAMGLTANDQDQIIARMFGGGRSSAGIITLRDNLERMQGKLIQIDNTSQNFAQDVSAAMNTPAARFHRLASAAESAAVSLGSALMPAAMDLLDVVQPLIHMVGDLANWFSQLPAPVRDAGAAFALLLVAVGPLLWIGGQVLTTWKTMRELWLGLTTVLRGNTAATVEQNTALEAQTAANEADAAQTEMLTAATDAQAASAYGAQAATDGLAASEIAAGGMGSDAAVGVSEAAVAMAGEGAAAAEATAAMSGFAIANIIAEAPVYLIIAAVAVLAAAALLLVANWRVVLAFFHELWNEMEIGFTDMVNGIVDALNFMEKPINAAISLMDKVTGAHIGQLGAIGHVAAPANHHYVAQAQAYNLAHHHVGGIQGALDMVKNLFAGIFGKHNGSATAESTKQMVAHSKAMLANAKAAQAGAEALAKMGKAALADTPAASGLMDSINGLGKAAKSTKTATDALLQSQLAGMTMISNAGLVAARQIYTHAAAIHNSQAEDTAKAIMDLAQGMAKDPFSVQSTKHTISGEAKVTHHHTGTITLHGDSGTHLAHVSDVLAKQAHSQQFRFASAPSPRRTFK